MIDLMQLDMMTTIEYTTDSKSNKAQRAIRTMTGRSAKRDGKLVAMVLMLCAFMGRADAQQMSMNTVQNQVHEYNSGCQSVQVSCAFIEPCARQSPTCMHTHAHTTLYAQISGIGGCESTYQNNQNSVALMCVTKVTYIDRIFGRACYHNHSLMHETHCYHTTLSYTHPSTTRQVEAKSSSQGVISAPKVRPLDLSKLCSRLAESVLSRSTICYFETFAWFVQAFVQATETLCRFSILCSTPVGDLPLAFQHCHRAVLRSGSAKRTVATHGHSTRTEHVLCRIIPSSPLKYTLVYRFSWFWTFPSNNPCLYSFPFP